MSDFPDFTDDFFKLLEQYEGTRVPGSDWARYRQGSQANVWSRPGTGKRATLGGFIQVGSCSWTGAAATSGSKSITFPVPFADEPLWFINCVYSSPLGVQVVCRAWSRWPWSRHHLVVSLQRHHSLVSLAGLWSRGYCLVETPRRGVSTMTIRYA